MPVQGRQVRYHGAKRAKDPNKHCFGCFPKRAYKNAHLRRGQGMCACDTTKMISYLKKTKMGRKNSVRVKVMGDECLMNGR